MDRKIVMPFGWNVCLPADCIPLGMQSVRAVVLMNVQ